MTGLNELRINQATLVEAMQMYLDSKLKDPVKVTAVEVANNFDGMTNVKLEGKAAA